MAPTEAGEEGTLMAHETLTAERFGQCLTTICNLRTLRYVLLSPDPAAAPPVPCPPGPCLPRGGPVQGKRQEETRDE